MSKPENTLKVFNNTHYAKKPFWEDLYKEESDQFDWFQTWAGIKDVLSQYFDANAKILNVGCGKSKFSEDLYNDGYRFVISIDFSELTIKSMQEEYQNMPKTFRFLCMNALEMDFRSEMFTHALDKGTLDSILSGFRSTENAHIYLSQIFRVLQPGGKFICVSYRNLENRYLLFVKKKNIFKY